MESDSLPPGESFNYLFLNIAQYFNPWDWQYLYAFLLILVLLFFSALISGAEVAFFSLSAKDIKELADENKPENKKVIALLDTPRFLLSTILVTNNFINVAIIVFSHFIISSLLKIDDFPVLEGVLNIVIVTPLLVFFGEVSPKIFATQQNIGFAKVTARLLAFLKIVFFPISWLLVKSGVFIEGRLHKTKEEIDLDEIEKAIELSTKNDSSKEDVDLLKGIVHFGNKTVKQIMSSRMDMTTLNVTQTYDEVIAIIKESGYSRIPVFNDTIDNLVGTLYIKDILSFLNESKDFEWQQLLREPMFVPETKKIDDLLREFQADRMHQAIVVDEYGGTQGLVTLEDILEEVVGDIKDEFDDSLEKEYRRLDNDTYLIEGKVLLNDLCRIIDVDNDTFDEAKGESDSLAGLIIEILGEIPKKGKKLEWNKFQFEVINIEKHRIQKVKLTIKEV
ncbi:MAG: gliding motility-associated protein GldE [Chitinophagales bacterium]